MRPNAIAICVHYVLMMALGCSHLYAQENQSKLDFNRDIRPILSNHCFRCHGPDEQERSGGGADGLRLDTPEGLRQDLGGYFAVVPGQPSDSQMIKRITSVDSSEMMPPAEAGRKLSESEIEALSQWIQQGASFAGHWSYDAPRSPPIPSLMGLREQQWAQNPVDHFVLDHLRAQQLQPQPEADRYALVRRVALDVTGLPPTWQETEQFVRDNSPDAYEMMVERFLSKTAYGEHWARLWLDLARYADSAGYADDPPRTIWAYRDYVIDAFNGNLPFDQFTIEQLAGDLLPNPTNQQRIATAFHRNTLTNNEGGTNDEEFRNVAVVDRVNTTYAVWMGTTMACAQCHTHKYDPLSQHEFYQSLAIFNNCADADRGDESPLLEVWTEEQQSHRNVLQKQLASELRTLESTTPELVESFRRWEQGLSRQPKWMVPQVIKASSQGGVTLNVHQETNIIRSALGAAKDNFVIELTGPESAMDQPLSVHAVRLDALADPDLPGGGPGWAGGNFVLSQVQASVLPPADTRLMGRWVRIELPGSERILSLAEVEVFSGDQNIASRGLVSQKSTAFDGNAGRAIDGQTSGNYFAENSVTHSKPNESDPWWEVDLGQSSAIDKVVVWNRTDGGAPIMERLRGAVVQVLDNQRQVVWQRSIEDVALAKSEWTIDAIQHAAWAAVFSSFDQDGFAAKNLVAKPVDLNRGWAVGGATARDHHLTLVLEQPLKLVAGSRLKIDLLHQSPHSQHVLGRFRISLTTDQTIQQWAAIPKEVKEVLTIDVAQRTSQQQDQLLQYYRTIASELAEARERVIQLQTQIAEFKPQTTVPIMQELPEEKRRVTRVQLRGNFMDLGDQVQPGIPALFRAGDQPVADRFAFARWLVSRENPLTARVTVNRYWEQLFGTGLVATAEEFGSQGDLPSHPELLDWLAVDFMDSGWNMKHLLRTLLMSATYRQSSHVNQELAQLDPDNRSLARGPRFRLPAETIRDQALAVAGLLSPKMYGPPVKPPQPSLGLSAAFGSSTDWQTSGGDDRYRRGIYTAWRRSNPYPSMSAFDAPTREVCTLRRVRTNTPLQALVTLNDPVYIEAAQAYARTVIQQPGSLEVRMEFALSRALQRPVSTTEAEVLMRLYDQAFSLFKQQPDQANKLATEPIGPVPAGMDVIELATWTVVSNSIFNLDEFLMRL